MNKNSLIPSILMVFLEQKEEWRVKRYIISTTFSFTSAKAMSELAVCMALKGRI